MLCSGSPSTLFDDPECKNKSNVVASRTSGGGVSSGIGDIAALVKYRVMKFGGETGGLAVLGTVRLPTGDRENLRGLGISRTLVALIASWDKGKLKPHANGGFEFWSDGVEVVGDPVKDSVVKVKQPGGVRRWRGVRSGGQADAAPGPPRTAHAGRRHDGVPHRRRSRAPWSSTPLACRRATSRSRLAPGLKVNIKGKILIALNALVPIYDEGLHDRFTPVASLELNF